MRAIINAARLSLTAFAHNVTLPLHIEILQNLLLQLCMACKESVFGLDNISDIIYWSHNKVCRLTGTNE